MNHIMMQSFAINSLYIVKYCFHVFVFIYGRYLLVDVLVL